MTINKESILLRLKEAKITISDKDLDEVINVYIPLIKYLGYVTRKDYRQPFSFTKGKVGIGLFRIFKDLIIIQQRGLLKYIDVISIENNIKPSWINTTYLAHTYLENIIEIDNNKEDAFIYEISKTEQRPVWHYLHASGNYFLFTNYISETYRVMIQKFKSIFHLLYGLSDNNINYFIKYVNFIYYYFLDKDILSKEPERAKAFLDSIEADINGSIDRVNLYKSIKDNEIDNIKVMFLYIDHMYHNFDSKIKIIN